MDVGRALTFLTEDKDWITKLIIGVVVALLSVLILPAFLLVGYMVAVTRRVMGGQELPLPDWGEDLAKLFTDGLVIFIAQLVYTLPFWLLACIGVVATFGLGATGDEGIFGVGVTLTYLVLGCLGLLFAIALMFISPAIVIQYARTNDFGACFRFGEVLDIARNNIGNILIVVVVNIAISLVVGVIAAIPCLGWIIALAGTPYTLIVTGHLYGQIAANMDNKAVAY